jgi:hypothetical protein
VRGVLERVVVLRSGAVFDWRISSRMAIMASMKRSSSNSDSLSVGSTISVLATGKLKVGAWKP